MRPAQFLLLLLLLYLTRWLTLLRSHCLVLSGKVPLGLEGEVGRPVAVVNRGQILGEKCETPTAWQMPGLWHKVIKWPPNWYEWCKHSVTLKDVPDCDPPRNHNSLLVCRVEAYDLCVRRNNGHKHCGDEIDVWCLCHQICVLWPCKTTKCHFCLFHRYYSVSRIT